MEALMGAQYKASENPWGMAAGGIGAAAPLLTNPYQSTGKNIGYTVGASLLAGLLGGLAQRQRDQENLTLMSALQTGMSDPGARMEIAKENPRLSSVFNAMQLEEQQRQAESMQKMRDAEMSMEMDLTKAQRMGPIQMQNEIAKYEALTPLEMRRYEEQQRIKGEVNPDAPKTNPGSVLGSTGLRDLAERSAVVATARGLASELASSKGSWLDFQAAKLASAADKQEMVSRLNDLKDRVMRLRTGATAPVEEKAAIDAFMSGDSTVTPQRAAQILRRWADQEASMAKATITAAQSGSLDELSAQFDAPVSRQSEGGPPAGLSFEQFQQWKRTNGR